MSGRGDFLLHYSTKGSGSEFSRVTRGIPSLFWSILPHECWVGLLVPSIPLGKKKPDSPLPVVSFSREWIAQWSRDNDDQSPVTDDLASYDTGAVGEMTPPANSSLLKCLDDARWGNIFMLINFPSRCILGLISTTLSCPCTGLGAGRNCKLFLMSVRKPPFWERPYLCLLSLRQLVSGLQFRFLNACNAYLHGLEIMFKCFKFSQYSYGVPLDDAYLLWVLRFCRHLRASALGFWTFRHSQQWRSGCAPTACWLRTARGRTWHSSPQCPSGLRQFRSSRRKATTTTTTWWCCIRGFGLPPLSSQPNCRCFMPRLV